VRLAPEIDEHELGGRTRRLACEPEYPDRSQKRRRIRMKITIMKMSRSKIKMKIRRGGDVT
jgi:hypothetical protein